MSTDTHQILIVDDDPASVQLMAKVLRGLGALRFATNGEDALRRAQELTPDLVLLDAEMPGMSGFQVCEALKADAVLAEVPVIFVTSHSSPDFEVSGFAYGAADFIAKPVSPPLVRARVQTQLRVKQLTDQLRRLTKLDSLTQIANRRAFDEALPREWSRARRNGEAIAVLMIDVDHFKLYNDRYGHPAGDACLRAVARALAGVTLRPSDLAARYGGEEFVLLLPHTPRLGAEHIAGRVLSAVRQLGIAHVGSSADAQVSVSVGIGCLDEASACWAEQGVDSRFVGEDQLACSAAQLVGAADRALYVAKQAGRARAALLDIADADHVRLARLVVAPGVAPS